MKRIVLLMLAAILAGTIPNVPDAAPAPAPEAQQVGVFDRLRARRAARLGWFEDVAVAQEAPAPQPPPPPKVPVKAPKAAKGGIDLKTGNQFPRGLTPTPRAILQAAPQFRPAAVAPAQYAVVPSKLSMWFNDKYGVCVTTEEAYMWACLGVLISDDAVYQWAKSHNVLNGANLQPVIQQMQKKGFSQNGNLYNDGKELKVDYSNQDVLRAAIAQGPVKLGLDANALPPGAGNQQGWYDFGGQPGEFDNEDHCTGISGYGTAKFCFDSLHLPVPAGVDPNKPDCYLHFTWSTIGVVDHPWIMSTVGEVWVRSPGIIVGTGTPTPDPPLDPVLPPPPPPPPGPTGGITIQIPPGTAPGTYVIGGGASSLTEAEKAQLNALVAKVTGGTPPVPDPEPPASWNNDSGKILAQLGKAMRQKGGADGETAASLLEKNPDGHPVLARMLHRRLSRDADGQKLLADYAAHGATPGWLTNLLDWLIKNGPALLAFIQTILKLFGL